MTALALGIVAWSLTACQTLESDQAQTRRIEQQIRGLYDYERQLLLKRDVEAQERFYPEDFVVTNPFSMFIDKKKVMERIRADIIKYSRYDREFDAFRIYGNTIVVIGSETVVPTPDANRADAGKTIHRRFTEVWLRRNGRWEKVVRHASQLNSEQAAPRARTLKQDDD